MATVAKRTAPTRKAAPAAPPGLTPAEVSAIQRVGAGFVASLVRPGRNVTGFLLFESAYWYSNPAVTALTAQRGYNAT